MAELRQVSLQEFEQLKSQYGLDDEQARAILKVEPIKTRWAESPSDIQQNTQTKPVEPTQAPAPKPAPAPEPTPETESVLSSDFSDMPTFDANTDFPAPSFSIDENQSEFLPSSNFEDIAQSDISMDNSVPDFSAMSFDIPDNASDNIPNFEFSVPEFFDESIPDFSTEQGDTQIPSPEFDMPTISDNIDNSKQSFDAVKTIEEDIATEFITDEKNISGAEFTTPTSVADFSISSVDENVEAVSTPESIPQSTTTNIPQKNSIDKSTINEVMKSATRKLLDKMRRNSQQQIKDFDNTK